MTSAKAIPPSTPAGQETIIAPPSGWVAIGFKELWEFRELLVFLTWREIKVRYQQTLLGAAWAILQPLATMLIFTLFFGKLAKVPSDGVPYAIFALASLVPWSFFANGLSSASNSLVGNSNLIAKIYFPRITIPMSCVFSGLIDLLLAFALLLIAMLWYGIAPGPKALLVPAFVLLALISSLGAGFWLSALNVEYRDIKHAIPFLVQLWMFATPIAYPSSLLHEPWRSIYGLNPMVGVVEGFRWALLGTGSAPLPMLAMSWAVGIVLLVSGAFYFRRMEQTFADVV